MAQFVDVNERQVFKGQRSRSQDHHIMVRIDQLCQETDAEALHEQRNYA